MQKKENDIRMTKFEDLKISGDLLKSIRAMGFEEATPIQAEAIPYALEGKDLIGQAQTGTGKTAAFGIPIIERLEKGCSSIQGLVITPTRELAVQVAEELNRIGQCKGAKTLPIYGGQDIERQIRALKKKPEIIVGTPGRLMDHMRRKTIRLHDLKVVVLDEADEMLNMGFVEDIEAILQEVPEERQTLLFSATMAKPIQNLAQKFMQNPLVIKVKSKEVTVPSIEQYYLEVQEKYKFDVLCRLLDSHSPELAIVFGRTKKRVDELSEALNKRGYSAEGIHGDLTQSKRDTVLRQFKENVIDILVATDVAARGLDISGVTHVYNFDIPQDPESYVHRIGRTGRAGKSGLAVTLVNPREIGHLRVIEGLTKRKIPRKPIPTVSEVMQGQQRMTLEKVLAAMENNDISSYTKLAQELLEENDSVALLATTLKMLTKELDTTPVQLTEQAPIFSRKKTPRDRKGWSGGKRRGGFRSGSRAQHKNHSGKNKRPQ